MRTLLDLAEEFKSSKFYWPILKQAKTYPNKDEKSRAISHQKLTSVDEVCTAHHLGLTGWCAGIRATTVHI